MTSVTADRRRLLIDGTPRLVLAGEIHYFRLARETWEERIAQVRAAGCTSVATYIPWIFHELPDGTLDLTGRTRPERDLGAFLDLCAQAGLSVIARPGPFQMAELKNEGIPHRVYREHPEIISAGWDGAAAPTAAVDYLAPAFLAETDRWFGEVIPLIAQRLAPRGGSVIAVQLDNEIGMLQWVSNTPGLTPQAVEELREWILAHRDDAREAHPWIDAEPLTRLRAVRSPEETWAGALRHDLTRFMRTRFARYVAHLCTRVEELGVTGVPLLINVHGTEGGGAETFPLGISQLIETYSGIPGMIVGSDHYVGDMTLNTATDLYVMNAFLAASGDADQFPTSLEFEAGSGDYGDGMDLQYEPSAAPLKARLFVAQGNRILNYYLLAGGINPPLDEPVGDGNDRLAFTGERHGFAAPISPEGVPTPYLAPLAETNRQLLLHEEHLARADEELDDLSLALVLDSFATEYSHPGSAAMREITEDLRAHRGAGQRRALARAALLLGYRFDATDLRSPRPRPDGTRPSVLMVATARHMAPEAQEVLVDHLRAGRHLLLLGPLPERDLEGGPCRILADALGVTASPIRYDSSRWFPSVVASGWAAPLPELRVGWVQHLQADGADSVEAVLHDLDGGAVGLDVSVPGGGRAILLSAGLPTSTDLMGRALARLGCAPALDLRTDYPTGVLATTTRDEDGNRLLHILNVGGLSPRVSLAQDLEDSERLADGERLELQLPPHSAYMLAQGYAAAGIRILSSTSELVEIGEGVLGFGPPAAPRARIVLEGSPAIEVLDGEAEVRGEAEGGSTARTVITGPGALRIRVS